VLTSEGHCPDGCKGPIDPLGDLLVRQAEIARTESHIILNPKMKKLRCRILKNGPDVLSQRGDGIMSDIETRNRQAAS
jgi:hypothetical protein